MGTERVVICVGDIHGHHDKLRRLWSNLRAAVPAAAYDTALVIFLGDYCDRGPDTRRVIDFLISLPSLHPSQTHVFLCGNHDLAFSAFVGALPPPPDGSPFSATWAEFTANEDREGWFKGDGYEGMHLQGRRWGGRIKDRFNATKGMEYKGSIYDAAPTFESYGVPHGSPGDDDWLPPPSLVFNYSFLLFFGSIAMIYVFFSFSDLVKAVPNQHKTFLANLVWIHEEDWKKGKG